MDQPDLAFTNLICFCCVRGKILDIWSMELLVLKLLVFLHVVERCLHFYAISCCVSAGSAVLNNCGTLLARSGLFVIDKCADRINSDSAHVRNGTAAFVNKERQFMKDFVISDQKL